MKLIKRDQIMQKMQLEIQKTQEDILVFLNDSIKTSSENQFLESVVKDYKNYHKYILEQKQREHNQMEKLLLYLENTLKEADMSKEMANRARFQQNQILGEMERVKIELDKITILYKYSYGEETIKYFRKYINKRFSLFTITISNS